MTQRKPYRLAEGRETALEKSVPRIYGLETEYALLYIADDPASPTRPEFHLIQDLVFTALLAKRRAAVSAGLKGGYFLENGGLVHMEIYLRDQSDTPILEIATPECRSPWDLLVYARSYDELLIEVTRDATRKLRSEHGFRGRIAFGKNNVDARGAGFGSHENYRVYYSVSAREKWAYFGILPFVLLLAVPPFLLLVASVLVVGLAVLAARAVPYVAWTSQRLWRASCRKVPALRSVVVGYYLVTNALLAPAVWLYCFVLKSLAYRPFLRALPSFVVTRQILCGAGSLDFGSGCYETSQRSALTASVSNIIMFGRRKTLFDLKSFLYDPVAFFRPAKKLTITGGDSNLADVPSLLKLATTALIIEMVEAGETFDSLRLKRPLEAFRSVSRDGPWKQLVLAHGRRASAIEIQREYLDRARTFFRDRLEDTKLRPGEILKLWEEMLVRLSDEPHELSSSLDWCAKKAVLDAAILPVCGWKTFFAWGRLFARAPAERLTAARSLDHWVSLAAPWHRTSLRREATQSKLDPDDFESQRQLYLQARKIDLRYHELSESPGYERELEHNGLLERLTTDEDVELATREAPRDTRARIRGYYIGLNPVPEALQVSWGGIELQSPSRQISLPDPFFHRLPND